MKRKIAINDAPFIYFSIDEIVNCTIEEAAKNILAIKDRIKEVYDRRSYSYPTVVFTPFESYEFIELYFSESDNDELYFTVSRTETDEEYDLRIKRELEDAEKRKIAAETRKKNKENKQRALYEKLKKQYETERNE